MLGEADRPGDQKRARVDDPQVDRHRLGVGADLGADLTDPYLGPARADIVVELGDAADDVIVGRSDAPAIIRQPGHVRGARDAGHRMGAAIAELAPVGIAKLALADRRVKALGEHHGTGELAQGRRDHQRAALGDGGAFADRVFASEVANVADGDDEATRLAGQLRAEAGKGRVHRRAIVARRRADQHRLLSRRHALLLHADAASERCCQQQRGHESARMRTRASGKDSQHQLSAPKPQAVLPWTFARCSPELD